MDGFEDKLGIAQPMQQLAHAVKLQIARLRRFALIIDAPKPPAPNFIVGHSEQWAVCRGQWAVNSEWCLVTTNNQGAMPTALRGHVLRVSHAMAPNTDPRRDKAVVGSAWWKRVVFGEAPSGA